MPVQVIGAGWGRTGTSSFREAMGILKLPCYHMSEVIANGDARFWTQMVEGKKPDLDTVLAHEGRGYLATCDFPSAGFWREQLEKYPDAKVVLTTRDAEGWHKSCTMTIFCMTGGSPYQPLGVRIATWCGIPTRGFYEMTQKVCGGMAFHNNWEPDALKRRFDEYNAEVQRECPKDKLLVFRAADGWGPLCEFLGVPVPEQPYPHVNDTAEFQKIVQVLNITGYAIMATPPLIAIGAALWRSMRK